MGIINLNDILPGMRLDADVRNDRGQLLMKAGIKLGAKEIEMLKSWGVTEANIHGVDQETLFQQSLQGVEQQVVDEVKAGVEKRFSKVKENKVIQEIKRIAMKQKLQHLVSTPEPEMEA